MMGNSNSLASHLRLILLCEATHLICRIIHSFNETKDKCQASPVVFPIVFLCIRVGKMTITLFHQACAIWCVGYSFMHWAFDASLDECVGKTIRTWTYSFGRILPWTEHKPRMDPIIGPKASLFALHIHSPLHGIDPVLQFGHSFFPRIETKEATRMDPKQFYYQSD